ncbi:MAG: hypothetical protein IJF40_07580 [Clostridia bacterium]|nr:hypothetical protein [Clostridia bacterium]
MIGLGTWQCSVDTMFFSGTAEVRVFDNNGEYGFELKVPNVDIPKIDVKEVIEEGNTINAVATAALLPGKEINLSLEFDGDTFTGFVKVPFIGKVKIKDGKKIAD